MKVVILSALVAWGSVQAPLSTQQAPNARDSVLLEATDLEALARDVAAQLRCPVCQGLSVQDSPTEMARDMKDLIRDQLAEGRSPEEVREYFVERYGEWVLLEPRPAGVNLAVYVLPVLGLVVGAGVVARSVRRWTLNAPDSFDDEGDGLDGLER